MMNFLKCGIALISEPEERPDNLVLVDREGRIRGIYDYGDADETDRLILELKILKSQK